MSDDDPNGPFTDPDQARAYLNGLSKNSSRLGDTSALHPDYAVRLATAIKQARAAGLPVTLESAYRPPNAIGSSYDESGLGLHGYGAAGDLGGIGGPGSPQINKWAKIAAANQIYNPYGVNHPKEYNHWQLVDWKLEGKPDVQKQLIAAKGDVSAAWNAISPISAGRAMAKAQKTAPLDDFLTDFPADAKTAPGGAAPTPAPTAAAPQPTVRGAVTEDTGVVSQPSSVAPTPAAKASDAPSEFETDFPAVAKAASAPATPAASPKFDAMSDPGGGVKFLNSFPIVGPSLVKAGAAVDAATGNAPGDTFADRYTNALSRASQAQGKFEGEHPVASALTGAAGGIVGMAPAMAAAPALFGAAEGAPLIANALTGAASGAGVGAADEAARNGLDWQNIKKGGFYGALGGGAGPVVGAGLGRVVQGTSNLLNRTTPEAAKYAEILRNSGMAPIQAEAEIARLGQGAVPADVNGLTADYAGALAAKGKSPTAVLTSAMETRAKVADDNMSKIVDATLGPKPDAQAIVAGIRDRTAAGTVDEGAAKAALDTSLGAAVDPYDQLQGMVKTRSAAAQPLYEKAMQGGSTAPLETQFQNAFGEATDKVSQAVKELGQARVEQTLAAAKGSQAGDNVYANNAASRAGQGANDAVARAEKAVADAQKGQDAIRTRLQQAQADGTANVPGAVWNPRIQQFLDDPIVKPAIAQGVKIQRLEALAEGKPFNPTEHAIVGTDANGEPILGAVPNMRTLNVVKKGLDAMVENAKDPVTGRLSEEGRAIDGVRRSFLGELDKANPDYKAARQSWAGPSQAQEAFNQGQSIFRNNGVNQTPGALADFMSKASDGEKEAAKLGVRAAFNAQMANSGDPAAKAAMLANKGVIQQKLAAVLGSDEAGNLTKQLTFKYDDPVGAAFGKGMDIFKSRQGVEGIGDTPDALRSWMKTASPAEIEAHRQGARQAIEQALTFARQGDLSQARSLFAKSGANREKLMEVFPEGQKMLDQLDAELTKRGTETTVKGNSLTARRTAIGKELDLPSSKPVDPTAGVLGWAFGGPPGAVAAQGLKSVYGSISNALTEGAHRRMTEGLARGMVSTGPEQQQFMDQVSRAFMAQPVTQSIAGAGSAGANLLTRPPVQKGLRAKLEEMPLPAGQ